MINRREASRTVRQIQRHNTVFACLLGIVSSDALIYGLGRASARLLAGRWPVNALGALGKSGTPETWLFEPPNEPVKTQRR